MGSNPASPTNFYLNMKNKGFILILLFLLSPMILSGIFTTFAIERREGFSTIYIQVEKKEEEIDSHYIQLLKKIKEKLDEWLKSLNERIEKEDITRFEVRFLEILRSVLEWVKGKIEAKIESSKEKKPPKKRRGLFEETHQRAFPFLGKG